MKNKGILILILFVAAVFLVWNAAYTINETEQVVVTSSAESSESRKRIRD